MYLTKSVALPQSYRATLKFGYKVSFYEFIFVLLFGLVRASFHVCLSNITIHYGETSKNNSSIISSEQNQYSGGVVIN